MRSLKYRGLDSLVQAGRTFITRVCLREVLFKDELQDDAIDIWFAILEEENVETKWLYIYSWAQVDLKQHQFVEYNSMKNVPGFMESTDNLDNNSSSNWISASLPIMSKALASRTTIQ
ncbi:hypothetical protein QJS10_CPA10g01110 [Acorus calamus]|uniref:Uncharacterized protein n=1 Tax=Acorus calamus TaxID=4465 RepID=A0AAV9E0Z4_ACOCL|nr:hypothetical protein QJS10_CPA10g01110 [Acorus calamus]